MADDLDDLDEAEGRPQPPQSRKLVIVDLGHLTCPSCRQHRWSHRAAALAGVTLDGIYI